MKLFELDLNMCQKYCMLTARLFSLQVVRENEKKQKLMNFPTFGEKGSQYTNEFFDKHVTRKFYAKNGGVISYFDGIMNESELATLRNYLITHNTAYSNTGFSTVEDDDGDNVSWIAMFLVRLYGMLHISRSI